MGYSPDLSEHYDFCTACLDIDLLKTMDLVRAERAEKYEKNSCIWPSFTFYKANLPSPAYKPFHFYSLQVF